MNSIKISPPTRSYSSFRKVSCEHCHAVITLVLRNKDLPNKFECPLCSEDVLIDTFVDRKIHRHELILTITYKTDKNPDAKSAEILDFSPEGVRLKVFEKISSDAKIYLYSDEFDATGFAVWTKKHRRLIQPSFYEIGVKFSEFMPGQKSVIVNVDA